MSVPTQFAKRGTTPAQKHKCWSKRVAMCSRSLSMLPVTLTEDKLHFRVRESNPSPPLYFETCQAKQLVQLTHLHVVYTTVCHEKNPQLPSENMNVKTTKTKAS
ncbi:hypothetical protein O181_016129 [Austropuccinia psidii MF-1]|uniref:Uncharacterized protein n=1 Tax=Austropuccinia psidii MF-1 TaxID=1389203 RepID=A0A9Q3C144_9BASI|nr:hypothetical protein [Austropuccinia psidii MF-1]